MTHNYTIGEGKQMGGSQRGICAVCKLATCLPVHQKCGEIFNHGTDHKAATPRHYADAVCENVDCRKVYTPASPSQKLCPACMVLKRANHEREQELIFFNKYREL